jgi:ribosome maturation factor RimP
MLEVNSPGLDRPLKTDRDFTKAQGETLRVTYQDERGKTFTVTGRLNAYEGQMLDMTVQPKSTPLSVPLAKVLKAVRDIRI